MGYSNNYSTKETRPLKSSKAPASLTVRLLAFNKSINIALNGNSVTSYYHLPNVIDPLERLQKCTISSSLYLLSGYHHIRLTLEAKPKTAFSTSGKWHWNVAPLSICSLPDVFCYHMTQVLSGLDFCSVYLVGILVYSIVERASAAF